jgi:hypothetical protein
MKKLLPPWGEAGRGSKRRDHEKNFLIILALAAFAAVESIYSRMNKQI